MKTALISVWDKTGADELASFLSAHGWRIVSTGGTARRLRESGLKIVEVAELTGFPEMLSGRVKSLHPAVHAGILARRSDPEDLRQLEEAGIGTVDLVAVNLYPFSEEVSDGTGLEQALELIDIGGAALLRAAAKNFPGVVVLSDPDDYPAVVEEYRDTGEVSLASRRLLAARAFRRLSAYDRAVARYLAAAEPGEFPEVLELTGKLRLRMRYGENPHQQAALYAIDGGFPGTSLLDGVLLQGKALSYNNILDLESALAVSLELGDRSAVIVKHNNPCGAAVRTALPESYRAARSTDPVSAFGGVVAVNGPVEEDLGRELASTFLEAVVAPSFSSGAKAVLAAKKNLRLLEVPGGFSPRRAFRSLRSICGGVLVQDEDLLLWDREALEVVTKTKPDSSRWDDIEFAWKVVKHARSNAIVLAAEKRAIGIGVGQMSRIDAARLAVEKARAAGLDTRGSVLASDAFFPFRDVVDLAADAGVGVIVQPGGSKRDGESIAAADEKSVAMVFTGIRHFRH